MKRYDVLTGVSQRTGDPDMSSRQCSQFLPEYRVGQCGSSLSEPSSPCRCPVAATQTTQSPIRTSRNATLGIIALEFVVSQSLQFLSARFA